MLPKQAVIEYQQIHKKVFGKEISFQVALIEATKLLNLVLIIEDEDKYENEEHKSFNRD